MFGIVLIFAASIGRMYADCEIYLLNEGSYCVCSNSVNYTDALKACDRDDMVALEIDNNDLVYMNYETNLLVTNITKTVKLLVISNNKRLEFEEKTEETVFNNFRNLESLIMRRNNLNKLSTNLIKGSKITYLDLQHNQFSSIPKFVSNALKKLDLRHNVINEISRDNFRNLPALEEIILEDNRLQTVDSQIFLKLRNLKRLFLYANRWECNCQSVQLFRKLAEIVNTENELECGIGTDNEQIIADANGITPEFVRMCPLALETEFFFNNGVVRKYQPILLIIYSFNVFYYLIEAITHTLYTL